MEGRLIEVRLYMEFTVHGWWYVLTDLNNMADYRVE